MDPVDDLTESCGFLSEEKQLILLRTSGLYSTRNGYHPLCALKITNVSWNLSLKN